MHEPTHSLLLDLVEERKASRLTVENKLARSDAMNAKAVARSSSGNPSSRWSNAALK